MEHRRASVAAHHLFLRRRRHQKMAVLRLGSLAAAAAAAAAAAVCGGAVSAAAAGGAATAPAHSSFRHRPVASAVATRVAMRWRGGATVPMDHEDEHEEDEDEDVGVEERSIRVTVGTAVGSPHLDLKTRFDLKGSTTVGALKSHVENQMKGE